LSEVVMRRPLEVFACFTVEPLACPPGARRLSSGMLAWWDWSPATVRWSKRRPGGYQFCQPGPSATGWRA